ncbi:MAG: adenylosuccinate lyase [Flavobacteriales bacterium]|nr:adenylosuccinate lyase [Flavobacteriales bacterium]MCX7768504.1 adenylosuccinate lyase [Flavobacteriales bacterium]MDW8409836.1 adenylosuccinate lyase [Flavobacteriales bacterium]
MSSAEELLAISPLDGRYASKTKPLQEYFSEYALIRYRVFVEWSYLRWLLSLPLPGKDFGHLLSRLPEPEERFRSFSLTQALRVKELENLTNHDVKAVEYLVREELRNIGLEEAESWVHFGLTSQDVNNVAVPLALRDFCRQHLYPALLDLVTLLRQYAAAWNRYPMLARTHGQPASPTRLGKEIRVFAVRLQVQLRGLQKLPFAAKFGGATGNFNAHFAAFPQLPWHQLADKFITDFGLVRSHPTTQIEHYDTLAAWCQNLSRICTILMDLCQDIWLYVALDYFRQTTREGEVGSSAMPHKVNPIDFENAEGNLGIARALFEHMAMKLPISRWQRDLTDSTVLRNLGVPVGHLWIAIQGVQQGIRKLRVNTTALKADLQNHPEVVTEAYQTILRREGLREAYEMLRDFTRGKTVTLQMLHTFVDSLPVNDQVKAELKRWAPHRYLGR